MRDVERLLAQLETLSGRDSKIEQFSEALRLATDDGRACLVFSEFTDTVEYLRDVLFPQFGSSVACYTGDGGLVFEDGRWRTVSKDDITDRLAARKLRVLLCSDAASEGLNLQVASALINYDLPWNPARVEQRIGRIDRIGQEAGVLRIVNLVLAESVDERVYQVLSQRCDLFQSYVGAMQPVLSVARRMLLGVVPFNAEVLKAEADRAATDTLASAAFAATNEEPPRGTPPGVTIEDLARAFGLLSAAVGRDLTSASVRMATSSKALAADGGATPLSPFSATLRRLGADVDMSADRLPLVLATAEEGAFRVVAAVWVSGTECEVVERAERLEALLGQWDGSVVTEERWQAGHAVAHAHAVAALRTMVALALEKERAGLGQQVVAARERLLRELGRFLACSANEGEDFNSAFHRAMQRGGAVGALLARAHGLVGYPDWSAELIYGSRAAVDQLSTNQRKNVMLGTPLEAAVRDPRWRASDTLAQRFSS
jgi:hypothetical protein